MTYFYTIEWVWNSKRWWYIRTKIRRLWYILIDSRERFDVFSITVLYEMICKERFEFHSRLYDITWFEAVYEFKSGTCKVRNEIETKRNQSKRNQSKRNQSKRNEIDRNETKPNETKRNETKIETKLQNQIKWICHIFVLNIFELNNPTLSSHC
jgi:uncharacterized protein YlxW (UPF0749 family)